MRLQAWLPPVVWMVIILWLGSDTASAEQTGRVLMPVLRFLFPTASPVQLDVLHALVRKAGHVLEYAVLAGLWVRALVALGWSRPRVAGVAWAIAAGWAVLDETRQAGLVSRTGSAFDVVLDAAGALIVALPAGAGVARTVEAATRVLLWLAAVGGATLLALDLASDVPAGLLWVTVPAAVALLVLRRLRARSR